MICLQEDRGDGPENYGTKVLFFIDSNSLQPKIENEGAIIMQKGLEKFLWGFIFIMLSFRIQGFDILPDVIGYVLFAMGFYELAERSEHFRIAAKYNVPMIVLSLFSIYSRPQNVESNFSGLTLLLVFMLSIVSFCVSLYVVYNLLMGIREIVQKMGNTILVAETDKRWRQYRMLQFAILASMIIILIPALGLLYIIGVFIATIVFLVDIKRYIDKCKLIEVMGN